MKSSRRLAFTMVAATLILAGPQAPGAVERNPHIGYLYPAGGGQGTTRHITIGGQYLQGATNVYISGEGVSATVTRYIKPLNRKQEGEVRKHLSYLRKKHQAVGDGKKSPAPPKDLPTLPEHVWLDGVEEMDSTELQDLWTKLFNPKRQPNTQIAETVQLAITIASDAPLGNRELRLGASLGLTNPMRFQVNRLVEVEEQEPDENSPILQAPVLVNGQILPGDVDRFRLRAHQGQRLQIEVQARTLIPYLADAVPGWFQAILTLYDAKGNQVACADDNLYHPDPRLLVDIPSDGEYQLEIRDAIFRGREDFVYRLAVVEATDETGAPRTQATSPGDLSTEQEPNDHPPEAEPISLPHWVAGCVDEPGDIDQFAFHGKKDDMVVVEAFARRQMNSPVDALIRLVTASGETVAWNDDYMEKDGHLHLGPGLLTHHADAYLQTRLPEDGVYYVRMEDAQRHGGADYAYRLRIDHPQPDFALRVTPSSLTIPAGRTLPIEIHAVRREGFEGDIHVALIDPPAGFVLAGDRIPHGKDRIRLTLTAPGTRTDEPVALQLEGVAQIKGREVRHAVGPADNTMQAFLWRHLVPAQELLVAVSNRKGSAESITRTNLEPVRIAAGGETTIQLKVPARPVLKDIRWELIDPPIGLSLGATKLANGKLILRLKASDQAAEAGTRDNLIIGATLNRRAANGKKRPQPVSLGVLPAIPMEIVNAEKS